MASVRRVLISLLSIAGFAAPALAGGPIEVADLTAVLTSPPPGPVLVDVIPTRWDARCIPVHWSLNTTLNPIPNPLGPAFLSLADARGALEAAMAQWNDIPTSFIDFRITGTTANPGLVRRFDTINELTFRSANTFGAFAASSASVLLAGGVADDGEDIDLDGDPDVSAAIASCQDVDGDGDVEHPAGPIAAGTILDNDIFFNTKASNGLRYTVTDAQLDNDVRSVDLMAVAVHEFGHALGLHHVPNNQIGPTDGGASSMNPVLIASDPASELQFRTVDPDDIAFASFTYPEGSAASGPAALQAGDVAFESVYGLIRGEIVHGVLGEPVAGASVFALDRRTRKLVSSGFSGTTRLLFDPTTGLSFPPSSADGVVDGAYVIPVPYGQYLVGIEALDGFPVPAAAANFTAQIGAFYGHHDFAEELYQAGGEGALEAKHGLATAVAVNAHGEASSGIDLVTNRISSIATADAGALAGFGFFDAPPGLYYAVQVPAAEIQSAFDAGATSIQAMEFFTWAADHSVVPIFAEAALTTGVVSGATADLELDEPLAWTSSFVGQEYDLAPFWFNDPETLGALVQTGIADESIESLFLVLRLPTSAPFPGVNGLPPVIGASLDPLVGRSFFSVDGVTFHRLNGADWIARLILSDAPP